MKQLLLSALLASSSFIGFYAQQTSNIVIFAEEPKPFYAIVNGIKQNFEPKTNVKITGLTNPSSSIKVVFADGTPDLNKKTYFESMGKEVTLRIVSTKKGYKLRYFGEIDINNSVASEEQSVISYHATEIPEPVEVKPSNTTTTVTEEIVTTRSSVPSSVGSVDAVPVNTETENVNMGINVGGFGVNMNVNINETNGSVSTSSNSNTTNNNGYSSTTTTTTTTTTTNSSSSTSNVVGSVDNDVEAVVAEPIVYVSGYSGKIGCPVPESTVSSIKNSIDEESFSSDKMNVAKQATKNRCITVSQVRNIMSAFDFEDKKLEFAKYAYDRTHDVDNYYLINKDFDFSSNKESLNKYVESK